MILIPIIYSITFLLFWLIYFKLKKIGKKQLLERYLITSAISYYYFQPSIISNLSEALDCTKIGKYSYITNYLIEQCTDNNRYSNWMFSAILPSFIIYAFVLPAITFSYMWKHKNNLYDTNIIYKIGYMLNGLCKDKFYW